MKNLVRGMKWSVRRYLIDDWIGVSFEIAITIIFYVIVTHWG